MTHTGRRYPLRGIFVIEVELLDSLTVVVYQVPVDTVVVSYTVFTTVGRAGSPAVSSSSFTIEAGSSQVPTYWVAVPCTVMVTVGRSLPLSKKPLWLVRTSEDKAKVVGENVSARCLQISALTDAQRNRGR